ncbi:S24 family peptidase [Bacteroides stercorirosoris]|jgi:transcriptional regulator with XRE-family HTH domain|uniref:Phage repressor protein C, contains Cro/C1-type HTH and peptisase s24 domains n=1 Tax=Bacteroides stercorirosoris TaxID=871324 RepID=A0A1M6B6Y0_9BACE|nr:S24 family peptidase [Bacteroides stercorirosoris]OKZ10885.1 MAG: transcriptional regulator [Bacteroides oleiciplenus]SHI44509.1 Phage repressor protein C, contains Cro/C1-type HTH and peptisase s24 domains [Bacteroides stercorirosoris]
MEKEKDLLFNVADIVKRAKRVLNFKTDADLAAYLGVSRSTLSNWVARNSIDFPLLLSKLKDVDYNWLLLGKKPLIPQSETSDALKDRTVMLYDIAAAANLRTLLANKQQYVVGKIQIPSIPVCDGAVYISGDSMYPILKSGDIVGFKEINSFGNVIYGEMYLVSFCIDGDEYLTVKYVNRSDIEGYIRLVSYNPHHEPMDVPFSSIQAMAIVKFSIRKNMMM